MSKALPLLSSLILLALLAITSWGASLTAVNHNLHVYFSKQNQAYILDKKLRNDFPEDDIFIVMFEGETLLEDQFITKLHSAIQKIQSLANIDRVLSITTVDQIQGTEDGFQTAPLFDVNKDFELTPEERKNKILRDRFAPGSLISKDGKALALVLRPQKDSDSGKQNTLRNASLDILKQEGVAEFITAISGPSEMTYVQFGSMQDSLKIFIPLAVLINLALISWMFPRLLIIIPTFIIIGISSALPVMLLGMLGYEFTMIHTMIPSLMSALCVSGIVHYLNKVKYYSGLGYLPHERAYKGRKDVFIPSGFAALTTIAGLASLALSPIPPIESFGVVTAISLTFTFFITMVLFPPILAFWDNQKPWKQGHAIDALMDKLTQICADFAIRKAGYIIAITLITMVIALPAVLNVKVETDVFKFFDQDHRINVETKKIEETLAGTLTLDILIEGDQLESLKNSDVLKKMLELQTWLEALPEVDRTMSHAELIEDMNWAFHGEDEAYRNIPQDQNLINQYLFIYDANDLYEYVNYDFNAAHIGINLNIHETGKIRKVIDEIKAHITQNPIDGVTMEVTGFGTLYASLSDLVVQTQLMSLLVSLVVITAFMFITFRSFSGGLLCMFPNISPIFAVFTLMGILSIWLDVGTAMIASIGVGIAVDDTIHLYHVYSHRKRAGCSTVLSLMRAYQHSGSSITATTFILASQFLVIGLSDFLPTRNFGLLSAISIITALIFDLLVLPALIIVIDRIKGTKGK